MHFQVQQPVHFLPIISEINFDVVPSGTVVNAHYPGVTLQAVPLKNQNPGPNFGSVFASSAFDQHMADTPPNVVTIDGPPHAAGFDEAGGGIRATFVSPQSYVSIDARPIVYTGEFLKPDPSAVPYMSIYSVPIKLLNNMQLVHLIATAYFPLSTVDQHFESWQRIQFSSSSPTPDIGSVVFSSVNAGVGAPVYGLFDRLRFCPHLPAPITLQIG